MNAKFSLDREGALVVDQCDGSPKFVIRFSPPGEAIRFAKMLGASVDTSEFERERQARIEQLKQQLAELEAL
jgi:hypothetical protein